MLRPVGNIVNLCSVRPRYCLRYSVSDQTQQVVFIADREFVYRRRKMADFTETLIENVKKHNILYDLTHCDYKNVRIKNKVWDEIAKDVGTEQTLPESGSGDMAEPLMKKKSSCGALIKRAAGLASLWKCKTVVALTGVLTRSSLSTSSVYGSLGPLKPINRPQVSPYGSSDSSSLPTFASSSRYSLNVSMESLASILDGPTILCKLCLSEVPSKKSFGILSCRCSFCSDCMRTYVEIAIMEGAYDVSCPDAQCSSQGVLNQEEIGRLVGEDLLGKHKKYCLNREIEINKNRMWCPQAGCETVCDLGPSRRCQVQRVHCPTCTLDFCSNCKLEWHQGMTCEENNKRLAKQGKVEEAGIQPDSDLIKCCPMCNVPIEKDEGCAQMICKRCKHVFCWYCLASLDGDVLLRHYDKGACKNKLGYSRASVIWYRTQEIGRFAGVGILLLVVSPLLLLAAPCIICAKCQGL